MKKRKEKGDLKVHEIHSQSPAGAPREGAEWGHAAGPAAAGPVGKFPGKQGKRDCLQAANVRWGKGGGERKERQQEQHQMGTSQLKQSLEELLKQEISEGGN